MKQLLRLLVLVCLVGIVASAQSAAIPINPATIDYITIVTKTLDDLLLQGTSVFVTIGHNIVYLYGGTVFSLLLIRWGFQTYNHYHVTINFWPIISFLLLLATVNTLLYYYATPIPGVGVALGRIPAEIAREIS